MIPAQGWGKLVRAPQCGGHPHAGITLIPLGGSPSVLEKTGSAELSTSKDTQFPMIWGEGGGLGGTVLLQGTPSSGKGLSKCQGTTEGHTWTLSSHVGTPQAVHRDTLWVTGASPSLIPLLPPW